MLKIREQQMQVFEAAALRNFEDEMVVHSQEFSPRLCQVLGEDQLRIALRQAMARATAYDFTKRGPMRLYIELIFLRGSDFDSDPRYSDIGKILKTNDEQMQRAEQIHQAMLDYHETVPGPGNINVHNALETLSGIAQRPVSFSPYNFEQDMLKELTNAFPQQADYVGSKKLLALIREGRSKAKTYNFTSIRAEAMLVILMFAFGHGCTNDPLYPWIANTLTDIKITDSAARAKRLEKKARTWLDHVIARNKQGVQV